MKRSDAALTTVMSYPERGIGGNNRYRGNCAPQVTGRQRSGKPCSATRSSFVITGGGCGVLRRAPHRRFPWNIS